MDWTANELENRNHTIERERGVHTGDGRRSLTKLTYYEKWN